MENVKIFNSDTVSGGRSNLEQEINNWISETKPKITKRLQSCGGSGSGYTIISIFYEESVTQGSTIFRFMGQMPQGKFEYMCHCGSQEFDRQLDDSGNQRFLCKRCDTLYTIWQQTDHWHLRIDPPKKS